MLSYPLNQKTNINKLGHLKTRTDMPSVVMQAIQSARKTPKHIKRPESPDIPIQTNLSRGTTPNMAKRDSKLPMRPELEHLRFSQVFIFIFIIYRLDLVEIVQLQDQISEHKEHNHQEVQEHQEVQ